jgi:hypothetical protein
VRGYLHLDVVLVNFTSYARQAILRCNDGCHAVRYTVLLVEINLTVTWASYLTCLSLECTQVFFCGHVKGSASAANFSIVNFCCLQVLFFDHILTQSILLLLQQFRRWTHLLLGECPASHEFAFISLLVIRNSLSFGVLLISSREHDALSL